MMDAYDLQQQLFKAWQELCKPASATQINKPINRVLVYVDNRPVTGVKIQDGKIILDTNNE